MPGPSTKPATLMKMMPKMMPSTPPSMPPRCRRPVASGPATHHAENAFGDEHTARRHLGRTPCAGILRPVGRECIEEVLDALKHALPLLLWS